MRHPLLADREDSCLLAIDLQEPFLKAVSQKEGVIERSLRLVRAARILGVPILITEQYPERMGPTIAAIREAAGETPIFSKLAFSCCREDGFLSLVENTGKRTLVVCGVEAHVCISQTVLDLLAAGYRVHVATDAVGSRFEPDRVAGVEKMRSAGAVISTTEMILFEWMVRAGTPEFKAVQALLK